MLRGAEQRLPESLAAELPGLLWLYRMGVLLFWIHDGSAGCRRTYRLIEATSSIVTRLIGLARNPLLRPLTGTTLELSSELRTEGER